MISRSNPREVVVSKVAWGTSGSKVELVDAAMDVVVSMKASRGERTWPIPLPLLICQRRRKRTLVQMAVLLESAEGCRIVERVVRAPVPEADPMVEK